MINFDLQIAKKMFKSKLEACQVNTGLQRFALFWLQTLVAVNSESCQRLFPSFCSLPYDVAVLFNWNLSRGPFPGQVIHRYLLPCTGCNNQHADLFLSFYALFSLRN